MNADIYDMKGRTVTHAFFDELEKIAIANPLKLIQRPMQLARETGAVNRLTGGGGYLTKGTPWISRGQLGVRIPGTSTGIGTKEYRMARAAQVREARSKARAKNVLKQRTGQAFETGTKSRSGAERAAARSYIQDARAARAKLDQGTVRGRLRSFVGPQQQAQQQGAALSGRAKAGIAAGGLGVAAGGGLYAHHKMNQGGGHGGGY
jgi:hypothetical protein